LSQLHESFWNCKLLPQSAHFDTLSQVSRLLHLVLECCDNMRYSDMQENGFSAYTGTADAHHILKSYDD